MLVKIHSSYRNVIAICDTELIGKVFEEGVSSIFINPNFYKGDEKNEQETLEIIEKGSAEDYTFNIVGAEAIKTALKAGIIKEEGIKRIQGIPIALVLL
jgi:hypothetical protein